MFFIMCDLSQISLKVWDVVYTRNSQKYDNNFLKYLKCNILHTFI